MPETTIINQMTFPTWKYSIWLLYQMNTIIVELFISSYIFYQKRTNGIQNPFDTQCECALFFLQAKRIGIHQTTTLSEDISWLMICSGNKQDTTWYDQQSNMKPSYDSSNTSFCDGTSKWYTIMIIDIFCNFFLSMQTTTLVLVYIRISSEKVSFSRF